MKNFFIFLLLSIFGTSSSSFAEEIHLTQKTSTSWIRHVLTEPRDEGARLLLVVDVPKNPKLMQKVVYRRIFTENQLVQFEKQKKYFLSEKKPSLKLEDIPLIEAPVWPLTKTFWTWEDEKKFSEWVGTISEEYLVGSGISVDCADFYVALRWIFSHDNGLPVGNTLSASGKLFGSWQSTTEWKNLDYNSDWRKDERFKIALRYILENSYTHSLLQDLYPVAINTEYLAPGGVHVFLHGNTGHTQPIVTLGPSTECPDTKGCLLSVWANLPPSDYVRKSMLNLGEQVTDPKLGGFLRYRWPLLTEQGWVLIEGIKLPGYSTEQYELPPMDVFNYRTWLYNRLGLATDAITIAKLKGFEMVQNLELRLSVTTLGHFICHMQICPVNSDLYEMYSTPTRDKRLLLLQQEYFELLKSIDTTDPAWEHYYDRIGRGVIIYNIVVGKTDWGLEARDIIHSQELMKAIISDPQVDFFKRWGVHELSNYFQAKNNLYLWYNAWMERMKLVQQAQSSCANSNTSCDSNLNTKRLDGGLRELRAQLRKLSDSEIQTLKDDMGDWELNNKLCYWNTDTYTPTMCHLNDYIFSDHNMVEKMSSDPKASFESRMGF